MQGFPQVLFNDVQARTQLDTFTSEATLLAGVANQAVIPSLALNGGTSPNAKSLLYEAWGTLGTTATPTMKWIVRLGATAANDITGVIIGSTATTTMNSGVADGTLWHLSLNIGISAPGQGTNGLTLITYGGMHSEGFAKGFIGMEITAHPTITWTAASWNSLLTYYISLSAVCGTSNSANRIQVRAQRLTDLNL